MARNRARRLMRESIRLRGPTIVPGYDVVLIARQLIRCASFADVDQAIGKLLRRAGLSVACVPPAVQSPFVAEELRANNAVPEENSAVCHPTVSETHFADGAS